MILSTAHTELLNGLSSHQVTNCWVIVSPTHQREQEDYGMLWEADWRMRLDQSGADSRHTCSQISQPPAVPQQDNSQTVSVGF